MAWRPFLLKYDKSKFRRRAAAARRALSQGEGYV